MILKKVHYPLTVVTYTVVVCLLMAIAAPESWSKEYRVRKKRNGYTVDLSMNRNPPVLGENQVHIRVKDPNNTPLTLAQVTINYYMPPMPGMPPMNYTIATEQEGDTFDAILDFIMSGPWNIVIKVKQEGQMLTVTFPIDVR